METVGWGCGGVKGAKVKKEPFGANPWPCLPIEAPTDAATAAFCFSSEDCMAAIVVSRCFWTFASAEVLVAGGVWSAAVKTLTISNKKEKALICYNNRPDRKKL